MDDRDLIRRCKAQKRSAQRELYNRYGKKLFSSCLKYGDSYQDAQDILQDSFITIFDKIHQYNHKGSFEGWMRRITINTALQRYRGKKVYDLRNEEKLEDTRYEAYEAEAEEGDLTVSELLEMIHGLSDRYRMVFSLYVLDGYSHREIAEEMDISEGTSKSNLARARAALKEMIERYRADNSSN